MPVPDSIQFALIPLGAFWVTFNSIFMAAKCVNEVREVVISGKNGSTQYSHAHRKNMRIDWCLMMTAAISACFMFAGIIFWVASYLSDTGSIGKLTTVVQIVALFPAISGVMFIICGIFDFSLMNSVIKEERGE